MQCYCFALCVRVVAEELSSRGLKLVPPPPTHTHARLQIVRVVADELSSRGLRLVLDPVLIATSGDALAMAGEWLCVSVSVSATTWWLRVCVWGGGGGGGGDALAAAGAWLCV